MKIPENPAKKKPGLELCSIDLYAIGKQKRYTPQFYKAFDDGFGIQIRIRNHTGQTQKLKIGVCVYDQSNILMKKWNNKSTVDSENDFLKSFYVKADIFLPMHLGRYHVVVWINDKKMQVQYFDVG